MRRLFFCSVAIGVQLSGGTLWAACSQNGQLGGGTVICSGTISDSYMAEHANITVRIERGAVLKAGRDDAAIEFEDDPGTLEMKGALQAEGDAIRAGDDFTLVNEGSISAVGDGVNISGRDDASLTNTGVIRTGGRAVHMDDVEDAGGTGHVLMNTGHIISIRNEAVEGGNGNRVVNAAGALIQGYDDALQLGESAVIENHGVIRSVGMPGEPQDAIDLDSGRIVNGAGGQIISDLDAAIDFDASSIASLIDNAGEIRGVTGIMVETHASAANIAVQEVINQAGGVIAGRGGVALLLGAGEDRLVNHAGGIITGSVLMGGDADRVVLEGSIAGTFGGKRAVIDGGAGADHVVLSAYSFDQITDVALMRDGFVLSLDNGTGAADIALRNWESFDLAGTVYSAQEIAALAPQRAPLTAGLLLLVLGFGGMGLIRGRRHLGAVATVARGALARATLGLQSASRTGA
ncbi:hypothetical protein [uncultured Roseovarius sp.]|uniref:hypothetical protein n=1 Tax=uncultured Roseovarius sp. TaxID=293344 RepID=UPI002620179E|nr:hypothetical protein [uncultured Roseovarius sp.]